MRDDLIMYAAGQAYLARRRAGSTDNVNISNPAFRGRSGREVLPDLSKASGWRREDGAVVQQLFGGI